MFDRLSRFYLLVALLLALQLGALIHGLTHLHDLGEPETVCELCVAYSVFDHALSGLPPARFDAVQATSPARTTGHPILRQPFRAYLSRAPPRLA